MDLYTHAKWEILKRLAAARSRKLTQELRKYPLAVGFRGNSILLAAHNIKISQ